MTSPYRNEIDALKGRKSALEHEVEQVDVLLKDAERRQKRMLDVIQVASPCTAKWDDMLGDERVRFCLSCDKNVYNLSALPRDEAERFVQQHSSADGDVCVRFYQRADGTVMTADCPVGQRKKRRKKLALAIAGAGSLAIAAATALAPRQVQGQMMQGEMMGSLPPQQAQVDVDETVAPAPTLPPPERTGTVMGRMRPPPPTLPPNLRPAK